MSSQTYAVEMRDITKRFSRVPVLKGIHFRVRPGEIRALVGENGAGKSTLMKILGGVYPAGSYEGRLFINGQEKWFRNIPDAERAGIAMIHQEPNLCHNLTIAENFFLGREPIILGSLLNWSEMSEAVTRWLSAVGMQGYDPFTAVRDLGIGHQQLVSIAIALSKQSTILILDEPTASLTAAESAKLFTILRKLQNEGVTCIYITHRLNEVFEICDSVTIMRDGQVVGTWPTSEVTQHDVVRYMAGREVFEGSRERNAESRSVILEIRNVSVQEENSGKVVVEGVTFSVGAGEIVGLAGVVGSGRRELILGIVGAYGKIYGEITFAGRRVRFRNPAEALRAGIAIVPEDRKRSGIFPKLSVRRNLAIGLSIGWKGWVLDPLAEENATKDVLKKFGIRCSSPEEPISALSGGNQQKVVLARAILSAPRVLILDEPTRGVDVGARQDIYELIRRLANEGMGVVVSSSDFNEVIALCDRILVFHRGRVVSEFSGADVTENQILEAALGGVR